ncbi:cytochrome c biogenesis protein ResB [Streptomyces sp. NBC_01808]|uniref:cytochrome c biogenesis protein ResB n=1 Tax=Streptomyces sp. NBC_01808 TaxID=2975947 RepID=UPI002DDA0A01|nr:cytochrome c biogenesis protein ResB [Streptomyces sp. NBC_01808]WSA39724.1 cytochrome c biogenesis protein ResB [Streptomyces sp. NBC_01808]
MTTTDERELTAAASQLSTAPVDDSPQSPLPQGGSFGRELVAWARWFWRQLTSMRVALILLFLLSLGAIPGSLIPQNSVDEIAVVQFHERHETLGPLYDKLQLFDVYSSVWFSAIYILLFVSLAGCIIPRSWQFVGQLRARPPRAPRNLTRLPAYTTWETEAEEAEVREAAERILRRRRFRYAVAPAGDEGAISAEKGYLREAGNLLFHIALFVLLVAFAVGNLLRVEGGKLIVKGDGFANTLTQYDDFQDSAFGADLDSFGFTLDDFTATFEKDGPQRGTAREFYADLTWWKGAAGEQHKARVEVNHPLQIDDTKIFLIGHGYAPVVTVRDGQGDVAFSGPVAFLPQDGNHTSTGAIKVPDYRDENGEKTQIAFQGFFTPTFGGYSKDGMVSQFPGPEYPALFLNAYRGDLGVDAGVPQNVYQLDTERLKQFKQKNGEPLRKSLRPGDTFTLPNGAGSLKFERLERWASFQVSQQPGNYWALGGSVLAIVGLAGSLFIQRRRVWVRTAPGADGRTVVELAGLGRSESARLPEELADLAVALQTDGAPAVATADDAEDAEDAEDTNAEDTNAEDTDEAAAEKKSGGAGDKSGAAGGGSAAAGAKSVESEAEPAVTSEETESHETDEPEGPEAKPDEGARA